jgi:hypothetical protein
MSSDRRWLTAGSLGRAPALQSGGCGSCTGRRPAAAVRTGRALDHRKCAARPPQMAPPQLPAAATGRSPLQAHLRSGISGLGLAGDAWGVGYCWRPGGLVATRWRLGVALSESPGHTGQPVGDWFPCAVMVCCAWRCFGHVWFEHKCCMGASQGRRAGAVAAGGCWLLLPRPQTGVFLPGPHRQGRRMPVGAARAPRTAADADGRRRRAPGLGSPGGAAPRANAPN